MRLLIHQALKDLRLLRWLALVWLVLIAFDQAIAIRASLIPAGQQPFADAIQLYALLQGLLVAMFAVIAVLVVQSDPAIGTTAFWFTRPISAPVLLASKFLVTLVLLVVVPILADAIGMLAGGLAPGDALSTVPGSLATQLAWLLPLLAVAAITVNLAQFVLVALVEFLAFVFTVFASRSLITRPRPPLADAPSGEVLLAVLVLGLVLFGFVALVFAYRNRTLRHPATVTAIAPVALAVLLFAWPWSFASWRYPRLSSPITATARAGSFWLSRPESGDASLTGGFRFSNVPPRQAVAVRAVRAWIDYPTGRVDLAASVTMPASIDPKAPGSDLQALSDAVATERLTDPISPRMPITAVGAPVSRDVFERYRNQSGVFHADLRVIVTEKQAPVAIDVRAGQRYRIAGSVGEIRAVWASANGLSLEVRELSTRPTAVIPPPDSSFVVYAIRNARLGVGTLPSARRATLDLPPYEPPLPAPAHLSTSWVTYDFPWPDEVDARDWMRGAQLVVVQTRTVGETVVHVTIPGFTLGLLSYIPRLMPMPGQRN